MGSSSVLVNSKFTPFGFSLQNKNKFSFRHFDKHVEGKCSTIRIQHGSFKPIKFPLNCTLSSASNYSTQIPYSHSLPFSPLRTGTHLFKPVKCSYSDTTSSESQSPLLKNLKNLSFDSLKATLFQLTPIDICKWSLALSIAIAATKWTANVLFSPFFWMYFSWTWLFWPWVVAIGLAGYGVYCFRKHLNGEANVFEQLAVVTSAFTWLTLVPPAHFNGFLEGWPYVFFLVYHYFFFFNVSVRKRLYGDYYPREHDRKWDVITPNWYRLLFGIGVMAGHWLAAFEGPELHLIPGGWNNFGIWLLIMMALFMQYHSTLYLAKYSEKVVVPTAVVQFGPYRWVRHPIYASTMLLFVTYFSALRAPFSSLFTVAVCLMYYGQKAKLEEALMVETFGESYMEYMNKERRDSRAGTSSYSSIKEECLTGESVVGETSLFHLTLFQIHLWNFMVVDLTYCEKLLDDEDDSDVDEDADDAHNVDSASDVNDVDVADIIGDIDDADTADVINDANNMDVVNNTNNIDIADGVNDGGEYNN